MNKLKSRYAKNMDVKFDVNDIKKFQEENDEEIDDLKNFNIINTGDVIIVWLKNDEDFQEEKFKDYEKDLPQDK